MKISKSYVRTSHLIFALLLVIPDTIAQTKKIKRPKSRVGISSVDTFVKESFDLYDKVYKYDGYAEAGTPLDDEDIDVLEEALVEVTALSESAPDILSDLDGVGVLKQGKATLQINKAKKALKFHMAGFKKEGKERLFISNLKVAEGGEDLRRKLMNEGKISTNGILFDSGSDKIQPQSYGIIRQISQVLMQDNTIKLNIVGHTDADGTDDTNLKLSKARAEAVKNALITIYKISSDRLQTDGKGERIPVGDNNTSDGKAQNRRVEFIKM